MIINIVLPEIFFSVVVRPILTILLRKLRIWPLSQLLIPLIELNALYVVNLTTVEKKQDSNNAGVQT